MGVMADTARKFAERAQKVESLPPWLPILAPLGVALIGGYMALALVNQPADAESSVVAPPALQQTAADGPAVSPDSETFRPDPLTIAVEVFLYMLAGEASLLPENVSGADIPVLREWPPLSPRISVVDYAREGNAAVVALAASGPEGEEEFIRLQVTDTGEDWIVTVRR